MVKTAKEFIEEKKQKFAIRNTFKTKDIKFSDKKRTWRTEKYTFMVQSSNHEKVFIVERNVLIDQDKRLEERTKIGLKQYRIGYFVVGQQGKKKGHWIWAQYCPNIPLNDFWKLINKAIREGTIIDEK